MSLPWDWTSLYRNRNRRPKRGLTTWLSNFSEGECYSRIQVSATTLIRSSKRFFEDQFLTQMLVLEILLGLHLLKPAGCPLKFKGQSISLIQVQNIDLRGTN